ncbi:transglycosylase SLT domain-containing protein [Streptomyces sp. MMBL 11-1]|uniref:transglycosylase SLT domain-containing protein n=1 Tax=Streptomyces sp. MMBL 11-1 TaxID=3026420 RepID=UPI00235F7F9C|nr:transglycosylase SLT domain-containing protein [Streptomyces sp. MMBL 11-1]
MSFLIASAYVRVDADTGRVTPTILRALRDARRPSDAEAGRLGASIGGRIRDGISSALRRLPQIRVDLDLLHLRSQTRDVRNTLQRMGPFQIRLDLSTQAVREQLRQLQRELSRLGPFTLRVDLDTALAQRRIAELQRQVNDLAGQRVRVRVDADTDQASRGLGGIASAIGALAPAIVPAAAAVTAGVGAMGASFAAAGAAGGVFALAVKPQFAAMTEAVKEYDKQIEKGIAPTKALTEATKGMSAPARALTVSYLGLRGAMKEWSDSLAPTTLPVFITLFDKLRGLIPKLTPVVKSVSGSVTEFLSTLGDNHAGPVFRQFGANVERLGGGLLLSLLRSVKNVATGFVGMLNAFMPMSVGISGGLETMTARFAKWGATLKNNQGFQEFLAYAKKNAPVVLDLLKNLVQTGINVAKALAPIGGISLAIANGFAKLISLIPVPVLTALAGAIISVSVAVKLWATAQAALNTLLALNPIGLVVVAVAALGAAFYLAYKKFQPFHDFVNQTWALLKQKLGPVLSEIGAKLKSELLATLQTLASKFQTTILPPIKQLWTTLKTQLLPSLLALGQAVANAVMPVLSTLWSLFTKKIVPAVMEVYGAILKNLSPILKALSEFIRERVVPAVQSIGAKLSELVTKAQPVINVVIWIVKELGKLAAAILGTVVPIIIRLAGPVFSELIKAIGKAIDAVIKVIDWLVKFGRKVGEIAVSVKNWFVGMWTKTRDVFDDIKKKIETVTNWMKTAFALLKAAVTKVWSDQWNTIKKAFTDTWALIRSAIDKAWAWHRTSFVNAKNAVTKLWTDQWNAIKNRFTSTWADIKTAIDRAWLWLRTSFSNVKTAVSRTWSELWTGLKTKADDLWARIKDGANRFRDAVVASFTSAKDRIGAAWAKLQDLAKKPVNFIIGTVYNKGIRKVWNAVVGAFGGKTLGEVKGLARGGVLPGTSTYRQGDDQLVPMRKGEGVYVSEAMRDPFERARLHAVNKAAMMGKPLTGYQTGGFALGGIFDGIGDVASGAWDKVKKGASWLKESFGDAVKSGAKSIVNPLINKIPGGNTKFVDLLKDGMKKAVQLLLGAGEKGDGAGGGAAVAAALKWARTQAGKPYQWGGAGNPSWDCSGFMSGIQKKILGQSPNGRLWSTFSFQGNTAPEGWKRNLKAPFMIGITNKDKGHTAGTLNGVNVESRGGRGVVVGKDARGYRDSLFDSWYGFKPSMGGAGGKEGTVFAPGSGVGRWRPQVADVLKQLGQSQGWQDTVLRRMNQESGGDPNVVNKWDSNWRAGHPSVGLMQVIGPTFRAYAKKYLFRGPFAYGVSKDPMANIFAGSNYAIQRYGSLAGMNRPGGYDSGGLLQPGATLAVNKTGKPEAVLTNEQWGNFARAVDQLERLANGGGGAVIENVNIQGVIDPSNPRQLRQVAVVLRDELRNVERSYR